MTLEQLAQKTKAASTAIMNADTKRKNQLLATIAKGLEEHMATILKANQKDVETGKVNGMPAGLLDRMMLNEERMKQMIKGIEQVIALPDPIGEIRAMHTNENGLQIGKMRVALGVVGMIYEARPNVTVDAAILCLKAGNAVMLRGSKDILESNKKLVAIMQEALMRCGFDKYTIALLEDTSHACATAFMQLNGYLDVLIPPVVPD